MITVPVELHTTVNLPCRCPICPELTVGVQWYRSRNSGVFMKYGKALAWWSLQKSGSSQGFGITDDFSMIAYNLTVQHDQNLYRCIVIPVRGFDECTRDVKLDIYANPNTSPVIEFIRETNGFNVTCSISNVFPMTFPTLTSKDGKRTKHNNRNGTYNTAVTHWFPAKEKDTTIKCLYSYLNFKGVASLRIFGSDTVDLNTTEDTDNTDRRPKPSGLWMVWVILITEVIFFIFIVIVRVINIRCVLLDRALRKTTENSKDDVGQNEHLGENSKVEEPAKSTRVMLFIKRTCAVISLTVNTIVFILLVAYLTTAKCLNEPDVKLEGNVPAE